MNVRGDYFKSFILRCSKRTQSSDKSNSRSVTYNRQTTTAIDHDGSSVRETLTDDGNIRCSETVIVNDHDDKSVLEVQTAHHGYTVAEIHHNERLGHTTGGTLDHQIIDYRATDTSYLERLGRTTGTLYNERLVRLQSTDALCSIKNVSTAKWR